MTAAVLVAYNANDVRPGWGALVLVLALLAVTFLLWRSMNTQLRKIQMPPKQSSNASIPGPPSDSAAEAPDVPDAGGDDDIPGPTARPTT
jgi:hypothetical protein